MSPSAAYRLAGRELPNGWRVLQRIEQPLGATGGHFSVGYFAQGPDGRKAFLKALDYSAAFNSKTTPISIALQQLTASINFEKYVLARCRDRRLDRVVISITDGTITDGQPGVDTVEYLVFELADCDARKQMSLIGRVDVAWRLRSLHDIATGLEQLHRNGIFHQDVKPSNVLVFERVHSKLADFGRSACEGRRTQIVTLQATIRMRHPTSFTDTCSPTSDFGSSASMLICSAACSPFSSPVRARLRWC